MTDFWLPSGLPFPGAWGLRAKGRWHAGLADAEVSSLNLKMIAFELRDRCFKRERWESIMARNSEFQASMLPRLSSMMSQQVAPGVLFSYSYAARDLFREAKQLGWKTILGQIDPGPEECRLVAGLELAHSGYRSHRRPAPTAYFDLWREELELADSVIVNSEWSRQALLKEGVPAERLHVIPIPYESGSPLLRRSVPDGFSPARPLRLLFLGQINLRKGIAELLEAMNRLQGEAVELCIVGRPQLEIPALLRELPSIRWVPEVPRHQVAPYFADADLFVLPTHSDGFGLTQVEALSAGVPVLTSPFCAQLVEDGVNGRVLPEITASSLATAIRAVLADPASLSEWSRHAGVPEVCRMENVCSQLEGAF